MKFQKLNWLICAIVILNILPLSAQIKGSSRNKTLIVFFDGLRPDYITKEQMPNLFAFRQDACFGAQHHSVFPTVTRVNSASYATGSYPGTHGILGNAIYIPEVDKTKAIGTGYGDLTKIPEATSGPILTTVSLGEVLQSAGEKMMVYSSGTTGQAFLQNYKVNGAIINPDLILPESLKSQVVAEIGAIPEDSEINDNARHKWITDALLKYSLANGGPLVSAIWFSDPDGAAHSHGIGSDEAVAAIKYVDEQFGRILADIKTKNLTEKLNIIISTDHGFVTHVGKQSLTDFLIQEKLKKSKDSDDVILAEGTIYVKNHDNNVILNIVSALHKQDWIGAIFTKPLKAGGMKGWANGTLSFDAIHYNHPTRSGDILVAMNWDDRANEKGYAGTDFSGGVAGHGGSSPYEINIALFAKGPDFKKSFNGDLPTSNVDIAPTILGIYNIPVPAIMDGRIVSEFLVKSPGNVGTAKKEMLVTEAKYSWGSYKLELERSVLDNYKYVNYTKVNRVLAK